VTKAELLDPERIAKRLREGGVTAFETDFDGQTDPEVKRVAKAIEMSTAALADPSQLGAQLAGRLGPAHPIAAALRAPGALYPLTASLDPVDGPQVRMLAGHTNFVGGLVVLDDGKTVVSSSEDSTVRVWDLETGAEKMRLESPGGMPVNHLAKSFDGRMLVSAGDDKTVRVWDTTSWKLLRTLQGHTDYVSRVVPTVTNGVLSASKDDTVRVWDLETGREFAKLPSPGWNLVAGVSPDGRTAVTCSLKNVMNVWDVEKAAEVKTLVDGSKGFAMVPGFDLYIEMPNTTGIGHPDGAPHDIAFSPDGSRFYSVKRELIEWDAKTLAPIRSSSRLAWTVNRLLVLPGGKHVALGVKEIHLCELATGKEVTVLGGHREAISSLACTPDGRFLLSGSKDKTIRVWDIAKALSFQAAPRHSGSVQTIVPSADGALVVTGSSDGTAAVWNAKGARLAELGHEHPFVQNVAWAPDGSFATATHQGDMRLWKRDGTPIARFPARKRLYQTTSVVFTGAGTLVTAAALTEPVIVWDPKSLEGTPLEGKTDGIQTLVARPGREEVLSISYVDPKKGPGPLQIWDVAGRTLARTMSPESGYYSALAVTADRAVAGRSGKVEIWDLEKGAIAASADLPGWCHAALRTPGGRALVVSAASESDHVTLQTWDVAAGKKTAETIVEKTALHRTPAVSQDGTLVLLPAEELVVARVADGEVLARFRSDDGLASAAFLPDGTIVAGDLEGRVHFLRVA
jgi:WD40 repeat protein